MRVLFSLCAIVFAVPALAAAQTVLNDRIEIRVVPDAPEENSTVTLHAESIFTFLGTADITWNVNGEEYDRGRGLTSVRLETGELGSVLRIDVAAATPEGDTLFGETVVRPAHAVIVWESDSLVPPFYRGLALPGPGTNVRAEAVVVFRREDGSIISPEDITYTWSWNGAVRADISGRGRFRATVPSPLLFESLTLSVEAISEDREYIARASAVIPSFDTALSLYEDHPLFGTLYHRAIEDGLRSQDAEMTLAAIPYFTAAGMPQDEQLDYAWQVNGRIIESDPEQPHKITVSTGEREGVARIELALSHQTSWTEAARGAWTILLSALGASSGFFGGGEGN